MDITKLPEWVAKVASLWVAIGTFLIMLGSTGVALPDFLTGIFSQAFVDEVLVVVGAVINFMQFVRAIFAKNAVDVVLKQAMQAPDGAEMFVRNNVKINKGAFLINPFKVKLVA